MDLIKNYLQQTQKPDGLLGSLMISSMNRHHAKLADWGMSHLVNISPDTIEELGCGGGRNVKVLLRKYPDAKISALDYSPLSVRKTMQTNHPPGHHGKAMHGSTGQCNKTPTLYNPMFCILCSGKPFKCIFCITEQCVEINVVFKTVD